MKRKIFTLVALSMMLSLLAGCANLNLSQIKLPVVSTQSAKPESGAQITVPAVSFKFNTPGANPLINKKDASGSVAGILQGLWHGFISPVTLIWSFANPSVQMYEVHNDGSQYNLGFLLGLVILFLLLGAVFGARR